MRLLVPTASFQYDVANGFARDLAAGIAAQAGHEVAMAHLASSADLQQALDSFRPDMVLSIQGVGCDCPVAAEYPDTAWMVMGIDHPSHIFGRIDKIQAARVLITAFETSHLPCWKILAPQIPCAFLAHPAPSAVSSARRAELGLCFLGTWNSAHETQQKWKSSFSPEVVKLLDSSFEKAMQSRCADASQALDSQDPIWQGSRGRWSVGVAQLDLMIRLTLRQRLLHELDDAGISVKLYGNGWSQSDWRHHRCHGAVNFSEALAIGARSLGVLSITPTYPAGSHERPLSCLAQGSVCLTSPSSFYREAGFVAGRDYLEYDPWEPGSLSSAASALPDFHASAQRRDAIPESRARIHREHSPSARARQILRLAKTHFDLD